MGFLKKLLFVALMIFFIGCVFSSFDGNLPAFCIFLNVLLIALSIINCVLIFISNVGATLDLIVQIILTLVMIYKFNVDVYSIGIISLAIAFIMHCSSAVAFLGDDRSRDVGEKLLGFVYGLGVVAAIAYGIYKLFFNK